MDVEEDPARSSARRPLPRRAAAWLFARRPAAAAGDTDPAAAPQPAADRPRPAPRQAEAGGTGQPEANPEPEPEAGPEPEPEAGPEPEAQPEADPEEAAPANAEDDSSEPESEPEPDEHARPRPFDGAPLIFDKPPAATVTRAQAPGESFFTRTDDDSTSHAGGAGASSSRSERRAERRNDADKAATKPTKRRLPRAARGLLRTLVVIAVAVIAALVLRAYVVEPYYVPSQSMEPTLHGCPGCNNDHVLVEKLSYHFHDVQAGDIVVFNRPTTWQVPDKVLIKRVIGVSGDKLTLKNGHVYRNGQLLDEPYVNTKCHQGTTTKTGSRKPKTYPVIPNGDVFVMGDNRCDSDDSRYFGVVPTKDIIGRAFMIIWPLSRIHSL